MNDKNYWDRVTTNRVARRRLLRSGAALSVGAAALALIGCGGDDDDDGGSSNGGGGGGAITQPDDTSSDAQTGGVISYFTTGDETTLDSLASSRGAGFGGPAEVAYSRLLREKIVEGVPSTAVYEGDLAESWEMPDETTIIFKLRDAKFDPRAPVNGRNVTAEDIVFTAKKMETLSPYASQLFNSVDPSSAVVSVTAIDDKTVEVKLARPSNVILALLAHGNLLVQPVEADGGFDPRQETRGSGTWMIDDYEQSVAFKWRQNPNWWDKQDYPYVDGFDLTIIPEYTARVAQFRSKKLDLYSGLRSADLISAITDFPELELIEGPNDSSLTSIAFSSQPDSPFVDPRIRRAISMSIDRQLMGDTLSGSSDYIGAGLPYELKTDGHLSAAWDQLGYWLNPLNASEWGPAGKNFQYDVAEAKKLVAAADADGLEFPFQLSSRGHGNPTEAGILQEFMAAIGLVATINTVDYNTEFLPKIWVPGPVKGDYEGMNTGSTGGIQPHVATSLFTTQHVKGSFTVGRDWPDGGQAKIDKMIEDAHQIFDEAQLASFVKDIQNEMADYMSGIPYTWKNPRYDTVWPWVNNYQTFQDVRRTQQPSYKAWTRAWLSERS